MAKGPCGEQFKAAFSCFIFSAAEPKGVDCLEQFKEMQSCFRQHPDVYGDGKINYGYKTLIESNAKISIAIILILGNLIYHEKN